MGDVYFGTEFASVTNIFEISLGSKSTSVVSAISVVSGSCRIFCT